MNDLHMITAADSRFWGTSDSRTIQNAVDHAAQKGYNRVVIPRFNPRTGENIWIIDSAILLPSNMTVVLQDAHLRLADGVFDNIFRNRNCLTPAGNTLEGEQANIRILGEGNALLDGGTHNGLCEQMHRDDPEKYPRLSVNLLVFFHNVRDFTISGLSVIESRWWSICCIYCRFGRISNIDFKMYATHENQDGIDLRIGCEYITIENITGITGDDTVAMTALPNDGLVPETQLRVQGKSFDIHDITIRNIISATHGCHVVRFLCEDGAREYNITVDGVKDTGAAISASVIGLGSASTTFVKDHPRRMGDLRNIHIRNVSTNSQRGIQFCEPVQDVTLENYSTYGENEAGLYFSKNFEGENIVLRNLTFRSSRETFDTAFSCKEFDQSKVKGVFAENVSVSSAEHLFRCREFPVENLHVEELRKERVSKEAFIFQSAYGRYHKCFYGKVIEDRPKDNRFEKKNG